MFEDMSQNIELVKNDLSLFEDVDLTVGKAITIGDPLLAFEFGANLIKGGMLKGLAIAKLLSRLDKNWELFRSAGIDDDLETMAYVNMGVKPATTKKYVRMWDAIFENEGVDDETKKILQGRNIKDLLLLTAAVREGDLKGEELKDMALVSDTSEIREAIRKKRGAKTSSNSAIRFFLQMQDTSHVTKGTLYVTKGKERVTLAVLMNDKSDLYEKALAKLVNTLGVKEIYGVK